MKYLNHQIRDDLHPACALFIEEAENKGIIFNDIEIRALDFLVKSLVLRNLWNKFRVIYPFVGRARRGCSMNLKNPFRHTIVWYNGPLIFNANGVTNTGLGYGNTFVAPAWFHDDNIHISVYNATYWADTTETAPLIGCRPGDAGRYSGPAADTNSWMHTISLRQPASIFRNGDPSQGFSRWPVFTYSTGSVSRGPRYAGLDAGDFLNVQAWGLVVGVNGIHCYTGGNLLGRSGLITDAVTCKINPDVKSSGEEDAITLKMYSQFPFMLFTNGPFGNIDDIDKQTAQQVYPKARANIRFASIGDSLSAEENKTFYEIVEEFQTILNRNVGILRLGEDFARVDETNPSVSCSVKVNSMRIFPGRFEQYFENKIKDNGTGETKKQAVTSSVKIEKLEIFGPWRVLNSGQISGSVIINSFNEI